MAWADRLAREAIERIPVGSEARARAERLYAHIAAAEHAWLARIRDRPARYEGWPQLDLDAAARLVSESMAEIRAVLAEPGALQAEVTYLSDAGRRYATTTADVLTHVALHGSYHRGQLAMLARQADAGPVLTDYMEYLRTLEE